MSTKIIVCGCKPTERQNKSLESIVLSDSEWNEEDAVKICHQKTEVSFQSEQDADILIENWIHKFGKPLAYEILVFGVLPPILRNRLLLMDQSIKQSTRRLTRLIRTFEWDDVIKYEWVETGQYGI